MDIFTILLMALFIQVLLFLVDGIFILSRESFYRLFNNPKSTRSKHLILYLLKLIIPSDKEQENIIGDLREEFSQIESKAEACRWLCKQVLKSAPHLIYKSIRGRLASYFGKRIR